MPNSCNLTVNKMRFYKHFWALPKEILQSKINETQIAVTKSGENDWKLNTIKNLLCLRTCKKISSSFCIVIYFKDIPLYKLLSWDNIFKLQNTIKFPAGTCLLKLNNGNTRTRCEIFSKLAIKIPERRQWRHSDVFIFNFEHISYLILAFLLLTLNIQKCSDSAKRYRPHKWKLFIT